MEIYLNGARHIINKKMDRVLFYFWLMIWSFLSAMFFIEYAQAADKPGKVRVEYPQDIFAPYRERRWDWSFLVSINAENFFPEKFQSPYDGQTYRNLYQKKEIVLAELSLGPQINTFLGSFSTEFFYSQGKISQSNDSNNRSLTLEKKGARLTYVMDTLFSEPYLAPYIGADVFMIGLNEEIPLISTKSEKYETESTLGMRFGLLFQLNWIDMKSAQRLNFHHGVNNTYLSIFFAQNESSQTKKDPKFETTTNWGAGLKIEF